MRRVSILFLGACGPFTMGERLKGKPVNPFPGQILPWHVDVKTVFPEAYVTAYSRRDWADGVPVFWQDQREVGRSSSTQFAPSVIIANELFNLMGMNDDELIANKIITKQKLKLFSQIRTMWLESLPDKGDSNVAAIMVLRDIIVLHLSIGPELQPEVTKIYEKITLYLTKKARPFIVEIDWALAKNTRGAVFLADEGYPGEDDKLLVHRRHDKRGVMKDACVYVTAL